MMSEQERITRPTTLDEIWSDDLLGRRGEAELLAGYIRSVYQRLGRLTDGRAHTIAVDGSYGEGKSFFLRRLAEHLSLNHPVAFVDAWADDLSDEPLTALAATLKTALMPLLDKPQIGSKWATFASKTGKVAALVGAGLIKRGLTIAITAGSVDAVGDIVSGASDDVQGAIFGGLDDLTKGAADDAGEGVKKVDTKKLMDERINAFLAGQQAIQQMKSSLLEIVRAIGDRDDLSPPIIIVVDELDRCRPTYAIKVLEEIKHLFDVPGLVFVFGLHGDQLAHSVSGAYGSSFDGKAYLRRFLNRRYCLAPVDLAPLVEQLFECANLKVDDFRYPRTTPVGTRSQEEISPSHFTSGLMKSFRLTARDAFEVVDMLQTCRALSQPYRLHLAYLLPLICEGIKNVSLHDLIDQSDPLPWELVTPTSEGNFATTTLLNLVADYLRIANLAQKDLIKEFNKEDADYVAHTILDTLTEEQRKPNPFARPENYRKLLATVTRFQNPALDASDQGD